jgi:hypothetical protein
MFLSKIDFKKIIFVSLLAIIIACASFFMITESARYYKHFYESGAWQPLYLAGLLEIFVLALAVIKIGKTKMFLMLQKFIMVGIFFAIIFAAGMQAVNPTLESLAEISNKQELSSILKEEYNTLKEDRAIFDKQRQKTRTAISTMERKKIVEDLKKLFEQDVKTDIGIVAMVNILLLFGIRFLVQIANIFCASMLGVYFRIRKIDEEDSSKNRVLNIHPNAICKFVARQTRYVVFESDVKRRGIGAGLTPKKAWDSAYRRLKN